jgi:hypothetical protein
MRRVLTTVRNDLTEIGQTPLLEMGSIKLRQPQQHQTREIAMITKRWIVGATIKITNGSK